LTLTFCTLLPSAASAGADGAGLTIWSANSRYNSTIRRIHRNLVRHEGRGTQNVESGTAMTESKQSAKRETGVRFKKREINRIKQAYLYQTYAKRTLPGDYMCTEIFHLESQRDWGRLCEMAPVRIAFLLYIAVNHSGQDSHVDSSICIHGYAISAAHFQFSFRLRKQR